VNGKLVAAETAITMDSSETVRPSESMTRLGENCNKVGGYLTLGGFVLLCIAGFVWGASILFWIVIPLVLLVAPLIAGLILLVVAGVIPEDPAIQREREKKTWEEEERIRAWRLLSDE
jgi:hypothetical protein